MVKQSDGSPRVFDCQCLRRSREGCNPDVETGLGKQLMASMLMASMLMATGPPFDKLAEILRRAQNERRDSGADNQQTRRFATAGVGRQNEVRRPVPEGLSRHPDLREPGIGGRTGNYAVRSRLGRHGPGGPSSGWHTLQGRKPAANAASREAKWTLCSGFVRRPGGQFGRQKMCVVVQPFRIMSLAIILALATG